MAKKRAKKTEKSKPGVTIHVQLKSPKALRKELLSIAIATIEMIKKFRLYNEKKQRREILMKDLRKKVKEIKQLRQVLHVDELPLSLSQIEAMPRFRKKKEAMRKMEAARVRAEEEWLEEQKRLRHELSKPIKIEKPKLPKVPKAKKPKLKKLKSKPRDKLQTDLDALRDKLASI